MSRTTRYILRQLVAPASFVTLTLTGVIWLTQSLRFVDFIINKGVSAGTFLYLSLLIVPGLLVVILPVALFCAVLYAYQRMDGDSELVVLRAAGLSQWELARPAIILAILVMLALYVLTLFAAPAGQRQLMNLHFAIRNTYSLVLLQEGVFNTMARGITVYVRERNAGGELSGILVYDSREPEKPVTMMAERGALIRTDEGPRFVLVNGNRQQVDRDRGNLSLLYFDEYTLDLQPFANRARARWREPKERYLHELFRRPTTRNDIEHAAELRSEAHRRLATPLYALAFTLLALAAVLSGEFNRRGIWRRLLAACGATIALEALALGLVPLVGNAPLLTPLLYLTPVGAAAAGLYFLVAPPRPRAEALPRPAESR